jgi:hypothetical protein
MPPRPKSTLFDDDAHQLSRLIRRLTTPFGATTAMMLKV